MNISRSGYYKWLERKPSEQEIEAENLSAEIQRIYDESDSTYGVERVKLAIFRELDLVINVKKVRRIMRIMGINSITEIPEIYFCFFTCLLDRE